MGAYRDPRVRWVTDSRDRHRRVMGAVEGSVGGPLVARHRAVHGQNPSRNLESLAAAMA